MARVSKKRSSVQSITLKHINEKLDHIHKDVEQNTKDIAQLKDQVAMGSSLQCVRIASDIKFPTYQSCNEFSYKVVEDLQDEITRYDGQGVKFHCINYDLIKLKGQSI